MHWRGLTALALHHATLNRLCMVAVNPAHLVHSKEPPKWKTLGLKVAVFPFSLWSSTAVLPSLQLLLLPVWPTLLSPTTMGQLWRMLVKLSQPSYAISNRNRKIHTTTKTRASSLSRQSHCFWSQGLIANTGVNSDVASSTQSLSSSVLNYQ